MYRTWIPIGGVKLQLFSFFSIGARREWVVDATPRPIYSRENYPVAIVQEAGWALGPVWTRAENLAPTGIRSLDRPTSGESLYYAIPVHTHRRRENKNLGSISQRASFPVNSLLTEALISNSAIGCHHEPVPSNFHPQTKKKLRSILILLSRFFGPPIYRFSARLSHENCNAFF